MIRHRILYYNIVGWLKEKAAHWARSSNGVNKPKYSRCYQHFVFPEDRNGIIPIDAQEMAYVRIEYDNEEDMDHILNVLVRARIEFKALNMAGG